MTDEVKDVEGLVSPLDLALGDALARGKVEKASKALEARVKFFKSELFLNLDSLGLPPADYAIFGSGPMVVRGLKDSLNDIDIIARGPAWTKAAKISKPVETRMKFGQTVSLFDGGIEIYNGWPPAGRWDIDKLIDEADVFEGVKFVKLDEVAAWKNIRQREGDLEDIAKINDYLWSKKKVRRK